jgi:hypothetical protein
MDPSVNTMKAQYTKRDEEVWKEENIQIFIDPENSGREYFQFAVNPKGTVWDARCTAGGSIDPIFNADCGTACKVLSDRWILEMKISAASLNSKILETGIWKMNILRNRQALDNGGYSTLGIGKFNNPASYRTVIFGGEPLVKNGGFEKVIPLRTPSELKWLGRPGWTYGNEPPLFPFGWSLHNPGKMTIITDDVHSGKNALKLEKGCIFNDFPVSTGEALHIEFWAEGENTLDVMFFQYIKTSEGNVKFAKTEVISTIPLTPEWKRYSLDYAITLKNIAQVALAFWAEKRLVLDDVSATKIQPRAIQQNDL